MEKEQERKIITIDGYTLRVESLNYKVSKVGEKSEHSPSFHCTIEEALEEMARRIEHKDIVKAKSLRGAVKKIEEIKEDFIIELKKVIK